ncbi:ATP-binding protein [Mycobacterium stomatepiae]|uniref:Anti-sigma regulatory factor n=1 Tax=Mycobacterium stomatepiae TaxID=470076 RepID=A0A7I7QDG8_9MYCO|nr:ATP-binding protein [Mycobacterium stomatepiae]MCV7167533.1 ATP-binding protein [Mycobacterium stomatepiae]BBY24363.1 anti-sigma regulatory factor [Mycobacterium stomatepiae]
MSAEPSSAIPAQLSCAGTADPATASELRQTLRGWLRELPQASPEISQDIILGVNEALANCVEHAYRAADAIGIMRLQAGYDPAAKTISVCVSDRGTWQGRQSCRPQDPRASRGIILMHALADRCNIDTRPGGTTVWLDYSAPQQH